MRTQSTLLRRLKNIQPGRPLAVMVGSALSITRRGGSDKPLGVPGVWDMLNMVRDALRESGDESELDKALGNVPPSRHYQEAFGVAQSVLGSRRVERIVSDAVLRARKPDAPVRFHRDGEPSDWHIPRGTEALGELLAKGAHPFTGPVLTTNFDPLISLAIKAAGGTPERRILSKDGALPAAAENEGSPRVVHLHGYWRESRTLHTSAQLTRDRGTLDGALRTLLRGHVVLVTGYGGWDDAFMKALSLVATEPGSDIEILWAFYDDEARARYQSKDLLEDYGGVPGFTFYYNVDAHDLFAKLAVELANRISNEAVSKPAQRADDLDTYIASVSYRLSKVGLDRYISRSARQAFHWPHLATPLENTQEDIFSERAAHSPATGTSPQQLIDGAGQRTILIAGAGFGKTTLTEALGRLAIDRGRVPIFVSLPSLAKEGRHILEYVAKNIREKMAIEPAWEQLAAGGQAVVFFDGLDEVPSDGRPLALSRVRDFSIRFPRASWIITTRSSAAIALPVDARRLEIAPLSHDMRLNFYSGYVGQELAEEIVKHLASRPVLDSMCRIPLFATLLAARFLRTHDRAAIGGPCDLLDYCVEHLLEPSASRVDVHLSVDVAELRKLASLLALEGVNAEQHRWTKQQARRLWSRSATPRSTSAALDDLVRSGLLIQEGGEVRFLIPTLQEYLAGQCLADEGADGLARRILEAVSRPWGQTLQFALVEHEASDEAMERVLNEEDDIFASRLRLCGRAICWGARVSAALRHRIGEELARVGRTGWPNFREECLRLLVDGVCENLPDTLNSSVVHRPPFGYATEFLLARLSDNDLDDAFERYLSSDVDTLPRDPVLIERLGRVVGDIVGAVIARASQGGGESSTEVRRAIAVASGAWAGQRNSYPGLPPAWRSKRGQALCGVRVVPHL